MQHFLFYNTGSGGSMGKKLDQLDLKILKLDKFSIYFASLQNAKSRNQGFIELKQAIDNLGTNDMIKLIIAGGDGTTMWVVENLIQYEIDTDKVVIVPLPFGTGNDFSNALGWGKSVPMDLTDRNYQTLQNYLRRWQSGIIVKFDIWDIEFQTNARGSFQSILKTISGFSKITLKNSDGQVMTKYVKRMSNYFSVGIDARIGLNFDKNRTASKRGNKCVYCWEGFKKLFMKSQGVSEVITGFSTIQQPKLGQQNVHIFVKNYQVALIDSIETPFSQIGNQSTMPHIQGNPATLICLNIDSYSGGVQNIWKNASQISQSPSRSSKQSNSTSYSDGKLEFITFDSILGMLNERVYGGNATKVGQGGGPFQINFRESDNDLITYFQIDGEYMQVTNPECVQLRPCSQLPFGKIKALARRQ